MSEKTARDPTGDDSDASDKHSDAETREPPKKRRGGIRVALKAKVGTLETQMTQVQATLDRVVSLLQPGQSLPQPLPLSLPTAPHRSPFSLEDWVQKNAQAAYAGVDISGQPRQSLSSISKGPQVEDASDQEDESDHSEALGMMKGMLNQEASRRLQADGHDTRHGKGKRSQDDMMDAGSSRRRESSFGGDWIPNTASTDQSSDPVALGICSELEGGSLFDMFLALAHPFMPVFDPTEDTWDSLRSRSPFATTVVLFIAKKIQDAGRSVTRVQALLRERAENMAKETLFSPVKSLEALQAMRVLLASWGDTGWRPGSHCLSMAFDMGLYKCLPKLRRRLDGVSRPGQGRSPDTPRRVEDRSLVIGSRLWLLVVKMVIEMSYNHGRPLLITDKDILTHADALLDHPLSLTTDSRLVASCELLILRVPLFRATIGETSDNHDQALRHFNDGAPGWERRWTKYYLAKGVPAHDILLTDLSTQSSFANVIANSSLLRYIQNPSDVADLSIHRREWLISALDAARLVARRIIEGEQYKLKGANHYSHVAMASVARIYLRLATLFPDQVDLRQTTDDIAHLADVLDTFPGVHFAQQLRHVVRKARRKGVFAPSGSYTRPHHTHMPSATALSEVWSVGSTGSQQGPTTQSPLDFDIFLAEQMLNTNNVGPPPNPSDPFAGLFDSSSGMGTWDSLGLSGIGGDPFGGAQPVYGANPGSSGDFQTTDFAGPSGYSHHI